ncbi:MAG: hypothetical protein ACSW8J_04030, partial [bacterium]
MLKHQVRINIATRNGEREQVIQSGSLRFPQRLLRLLFGDFCDVLVLTPGQTVETVEIHEIIRKEGRDAFYVFDCLSELQAAWATDLMMGNFFRV